MEGTEEERIEAGIRATEEFFASLGMPIHLGELLGHAASEEEILAFTDECSYEKSRSIGSFRVLAYEDIRNIYSRA